MERERTHWTTDEAREVTAVAMRRWPSGNAGKGWDLDVLAGWLDEMQQDHMTPRMAILGMRSVVSKGFVPSVDQVREAARAALPPMTAPEIEEAGRRQAERRRLDEAADEPRGLMTGGTS